MSYLEQFSQQFVSIRVFSEYVDMNKIVMAVTALFSKK